MEPQYLTQEKYDALKDELLELTTIKRTQIAQELDSAKAMGDLKENAEYHQAREDQAHLEERVKEIEYLLKHGQILADTAHDVVEIGATVTVARKGSSSQKDYMVVGPAETDPSAGKLSTSSPLVAAMLGKAEGEYFDFTTPDGDQTQWKIVRVK